MNNLVDGLKILLASNFTFYLKLHAAHWNVRGMFFLELHTLFENQYQNLWENTDIIAEKIRQLDCDVCLTAQDQITCSVIEHDQAVNSASGYLQIFLNDHNRMIMLLNKVFKLAEAEQNQAIMNYLADRLDQHAKMRWFIRASLDKIS